ncbi:hypothetical protein G5714_005272 [Onychostoma macrolepis]|uniref:Uncharacterized protein n=1 Tax=Onychostoma macrolepis TaxID=369639 RepID=A0A7J6D0J4_9TELE|nr:hypothetical protein G5714_005272 [Onychostoma macrolepis]
MWLRLLPTTTPWKGKSLGKHDLNPPQPPSIPSWDLSLVLRALQQGPIEPLPTVKLKCLSMKTLVLLALASFKRVGDLHTFSVNGSCLEFGLADSQVILRPRPGYVPKVPTTPFRDQVWEQQTRDRRRTEGLREAVNMMERILLALLVDSELHWERRGST